MSRVREIKNLLADTNPLHVNNSAFTREVCLAHLPHNKIIRQYLFQKYINRTFVNRLFYSINRKNSSAFPLPKKWLNVLESKGIFVNNFSSRVVWFASLLLLSIFNVLKSLLFFVRSSALYGKCRRSKKYVFFSQLSGKNIPSSSNMPESYTVIDWYLQWKGRSNRDSINHNVKSRKFLYNNVTISTAIYHIID